VGALVLLLGGFLLQRARAQVSQVALASQPKGAMVAAARSAPYRPERRYIGSIEPWVSANVGPQLVAAYAETVLVRPGDRVRRGQVVATLDCRNTSEIARSIRLQAKALEAMQVALARQASRVGSLLEGGFVSADEVEQKSAESASKQSQLAALQAQLASTELQRSDCVLRAPFEGEVGERLIDPGAFVRPGTAVVTVVDRSLLRVTANVPESDFTAVAPGREARIKVLATGQELKARIARRSPNADAGTRTVHFEADLPNQGRQIPSGTTADLRIDLGEPLPALEVPLSAATVRGETATVVVVVDGKAHKRSVPLLGERAGRLYLDPSLGEGALVVTEGRSALFEGDEVVTRQGLQPASAGEVATPAVPAAGAAAREGAAEPQTRTP
jgi:RND family efflux transporter MFP subunit